MINHIVPTVLRMGVNSKVSSLLSRNIRSRAVLLIPNIKEINRQNNQTHLMPPLVYCSSVTSSPPDHLTEIETSNSTAIHNTADERNVLKRYSDDTHGLPDNLYKTVELELLGYESAVLDSYQWFILTAATHLGIEIGRVWEPRKSDKYRFSLLKSAHIFKKHQVHYEIRTYHRFITLKKLTGSTASTFLEYIERNTPEGIGMKVTKLEVLPKPDYMKSDNV